MRDFALLYVNGRRLEVRGDDLLLPLSTFLRYRLEKTGTKVVCAEGDCGACAVLAGRPDNGHLSYQPLTSCIAIVGQFDCAHVITVEGLKQDGQLNALQQSMVNHHGAQCGYCTPGFVVTMCGLLNETNQPTAPQLKAGLIGNLCRCTGYDSILKAGLATRHDQIPKLNTLYPPDAMLADFAKHTGIDLLTATFARPANLQSALQYRAQNPTCTILAGGTDIGVQVNKGLRTREKTLSLSAIEELRVIEQSADGFTAGAGVTLTDMERLSRAHYPELAPMFERHGSPLIRNAGTLAGNIANGSPIADVLPALYVLNAEVEVASLAGRRRINLNDLFTGYKRMTLRPDELITRVILPRLKPAETLRLYKVSKRRDLDISGFTAAVWLRRDRADVIDDIRIAYGGVGPVILRLPKTETHLRGQPLTESLFTTAGEIAREEITPISDVRGSADYRRQLAENILLKFYFDVAPPEPVAVTQEP